MANVRPIVRKNGVMTQMGAGVDTIDPALIAFPGKNKIINGDFRFWQRGNNFPAANGQRYTADRWQINGTGSTVWAQRVDIPPGGGTVPLLKDSKYMMQVIVDSVAGDGNFALIQQRIEGVRPNSGKTVTVSFKAKASVANFKIGIEFQQSFGNGGSPGVGSIGTSITLGTDWQQYSATIVVPNIIGKTITDNDYLQLSFWLDAGANFAGRSFGAGQKSGIVSIAEVQLEDGTSASSFEYRPDALELALCQRYYEKSYDVASAPGTVIVAGSSGSGIRTSYYLSSPCTQYTVRKRSVPAVSIYSPQSGQNGNFAEYNQTGNFVANRIAIVLNISQTNFEMLLGNGDATVTNTARYHWVADSEL